MKITSSKNPIEMKNIWDIISCLGKYLQNYFIDVVTTKYPK